MLFSPLATGWGDLVNYFCLLTTDGFCVTCSLSSKWRVAALAYMLDAGRVFFSIDLIDDRSVIVSVLQ